MRPRLPTLIATLASLALMTASALAQDVEQTLPRPDPTPLSATTQFSAEDEPPVCLEEARSAGCRSVRIDAIEVDGLQRTRRKVVVRELLFEEGGYASLRQLEESMTRLRNLGLFREVVYTLVTERVPSPDGPDSSEEALRFPPRILRIRVDERWTLLPGFSFNQGGTLTRLTTALYDINLFGRYLEAGFQYGRLGINETFYERGGASNTFAVWARDPRFLDTFTWVGLDLWSFTRQRTLYSADDGSIESGFLLQRFLVMARMQRELDWWLRLGVNLEFMQDQFSTDFLPENVVEAAQTPGAPQPTAGRAIILRTIGRFGRVDQDDFYVDGWEFQQSIGHSEPLWGADFRFTQLQSQFRWYKRIPWRGNLAFRTQVGLSTVTDDQEQHLYFIGGLDRVRGYPDSFLRGRNYWVANAEYRVAPLARRWLTLQPVAFVDAGRVSPSGMGLAGVDAASAGVGLRIIIPKIFAFNARFDYAFPLIDAGQATAPGLSFGAQQFF